jgi:hypothetical protein
MAKRYEELTFADDFMFCKVLQNNRKRKLKPWISVPTPAWDNDSKAVVNHSKIGEMPCINLLLLNKSGLT